MSNPAIIDIQHKVSESGQILLKASGQIIYQTIQQAKAQVVDLDLKASGYILDLTHVTKIDSTGFGFILGLVKQVPSADKFCVVLDDPFMLELFTITKIDQIIKICNKLSAAETYLAQKE